jgi:hypothetical protein
MLIGIALLIALREMDRRNVISIAESKTLTSG